MQYKNQNSRVDPYILEFKKVIPFARLSYPIQIHCKVAAENGDPTSIPMN